MVNSSMLQELHKGDYELDPSDNRCIKGYSVNYKKARGVFCFVPLDIPLNVPNRSLSDQEILCYFLPERTPLAEGLALVYTHLMKLRFPSSLQRGLHFVIAPTVRMTKEKNYAHVVKGMDWHLCTIKVSAEMNELICSDEDLDNVEGFLRTELYLLMEIWYEKATNDMDREILGELEGAFRWREAEFYDNSTYSKVFHTTFETSEDKYEILYKFSVDIENWSQEQVISFLKPHINEKYIKRIQEQEINGSGFLLLTEEIFIRKPGSFEFPYGLAMTITKLIKKLKESKDKKSALDKKVTESISWWTFEDRLILLDVLLEYLPDSLPWAEIVKKFEERSFRRISYGCYHQCSRKKEMELIPWLFKYRG
ncbi:5707_t:CDS:2 [Diversispora eburnea]|uniref:5707_t:CDS:1 n=1 Tax=Diversispora eburnea TaxID=1213867 RepID=A0A9N8W436_9GLOM|nr:5707_t:CDS:2 [Diversispora eburnea]